MTHNDSHQRSPSCHTFLCISHIVIKGITVLPNLGKSDLGKSGQNGYPRFPPSLEIPYFPNSLLPQVNSDFPNLTPGILRRLWYPRGFVVPSWANLKGKFKGAFLSGLMRALAHRDKSRWRPFGSGTRSVN